MKDDLSLLQEIEREHGRVTPEYVLDLAADRDHPWHPRFEWDDGKAGARFRLMQARTLIRSVRYQRMTETKVYQSVAYVRDPDAEAHEQSYVSVAKLMTDEDRARGALLAEFARVASVLRRARELAAVLSLESEVSVLVDRVDGLTAVLRDRRGGAGEAARPS